MRIFRRLPLIVALGLVGAVLPVAPTAAAVPDVAAAVPGAVVVPSNTSPTKDYVVILTENASVASKVNKEESLGNDVNDVFSSKVKGFVAELDASDVRRLKKDPQVLVVEPDATFSVGVTDESTTSTTTSTTAAPSTTAGPTTSTTSTTSSTSTSTSTSSTTSTTVVPSVDDLNIGDHIPFEYIVTLRSGVGAAAFASAQADNGITILGTFTEVLNGFGARLSKSELSLLATDSNVLAIEENRVVGLEADQASPPWGLDRIDQRSRTLDSNYSYNFTGSGVRAYVIDTGVRSDHR
ncbi:MAG: hypothetical protein EBW27_07700, partial [Acidimicrobiia bacterium]|nr:hypothetical protein [Acidimicrobiia bacterium]